MENKTKYILHNSKEYAYYCNQNKTMAVKTVGRNPLPKGKKKKLMGAYLDDNQRKSIIKRYGNLTKAVVKEVLPKCG